MPIKVTVLTGIVGVGVLLGEIVLVGRGVTVVLRGVGVTETVMVKVGVADLTSVIVDNGVEVAGSVGSAASSELAGTEQPVASNSKIKTHTKVLNRGIFQLLNLMEPLQLIQCSKEWFLIQLTFDLI